MRACVSACVRACVQCVGVVCEEPIQYYDYITDDEVMLNVLRCQLTY